MQPDEPGTALPPAFAAASTWKVTLIAGIITLIVAFRPSGSLNVIAVLIGVVLIIGGLFHLISMFGSGASHRVWLGISGLLLVVLGVILIRHLHHRGPHGPDHRHRLDRTGSVRTGGRL